MTSPNDLDGTEIDAIIDEHKEEIDEHKDEYKEEGYDLALQMVIQDLKKLPKSIQINQLIDKYNHSEL